MGWDEDKDEDGPAGARFDKAKNLAEEVTGVDMDFVNMVETEDG